MRIIEIAAFVRRETERAIAVADSTIALPERLAADKGLI